MHKSADPLSLDKVVRRVVTSAPSLFPSPTRPKTLQFVLGPSSADGLRAFFFELRFAIAFQSRFGTDFGALWDHFGITLGPFWVPKIGPKAHWINVEGVYAQSLISNTPYIVLKDFGVQGPP